MSFTESFQPQIILESVCSSWGAWFHDTSSAVVATLVTMAITWFFTWLLFRWYVRSRAVFKWVPRYQKEIPIDTLVVLRVNENKIAIGLSKITLAYKKKEGNFVIVGFENSKITENQLTHVIDDSYFTHWSIIDVKSWGDFSS